MSINAVVGEALEELNEFIPEVAQKVIEEGNFITRVYEPGITVNGVQEVNMMLIVDFTRKMETDQVYFQQISQRLYEQFAYINTWHRC